MVEGGVVTPLTRAAHATDTVNGRVWRLTHPRVARRLDEIGQTPWGARRIGRPSGTEVSWTTRRRLAVSRRS